MVVFKTAEIAVETMVFEVSLINAAPGLNFWHMMVLKISANETINSELFYN